MTDQELKDLVASLAVAQANTDAAMTRTDAAMARTDAAIANLTATQAKTEAEVQETSRVIKEIGRRMGAMASNQGDVAEEFFYNSLKDKPQVGAIAFDTITPNLVIGTRQASNEFDIVLVNGQSVALIEVKYKAHVKDLDQLETQIGRYRQLRPEHRDYKIYGGIAGFHVPGEVARLAQERGIFVLQRKGEIIDSATEGMRAR